MNMKVIHMSINLNVIKKNLIKKEKKNECSCKQSSFEYNGKENVLIGRKGMFELKSIVIFRTITENESRNKTQLEMWANLKCGNIIFNSTKHG